MKTKKKVKCVAPSQLRVSIFAEKDMRSSKKDLYNFSIYFYFFYRSFSEISELLSECKNMKNWSGSVRSTHTHISRSNRPTAWLRGWRASQPVDNGQPSDVWKGGSVNVREASWKASIKYEDACLTNLWISVDEKWRFRGETKRKSKCERNKRVLCEIIGKRFGFQEQPLMQFVFGQASLELESG